MPNSFTPITTGDQKAALNQINNNFRKLDAESVTKSFGGQNSSDKLLIGKTGDETLGVSYKNDGNDKIVFGKLPDGTYGLIFYDANGTPSIYMVIDTNGKPVLKVAKDGKNAQTGADADMIFNSTQNTFKIVDKFSMTAPALSLPYSNNSVFTNAQTTVVHNLGYTPVVFAFLSIGGSYYQIPVTYFQSIAGGVGSFTSESIYTYSDSTNITVQHDLSISSTATGTATRPAYTVTIYVLQETAN